MPEISLQEEIATLLKKGYSMLSPIDLSKKIGRKILYIGTECRTWQVTDFAKAARNARTMGFDTICPKRLDGTIKWYFTKDHLLLERKAVLAEGVGYLPFAYSYAPVFNTVGAEVAAWQEMAAVNDGLVVVDLEQEWNGKTGFATQLHTALTNFSGSIICTTWGDPNEQAWAQIINILNDRIAAWSPQEYSNWLAAQESAEWKPEQAKVFPSLNVTGEFGPNNPVTIIQQAIVNKHPSLFVWEYNTALANTELIKGMVNVFDASIKNIDPTPIPHPPSPIKRVKWGSYIVQTGDSLSSIALFLQAQQLSSASWQEIYSVNKQTIEQTAKNQGYSDSQGGNLIFPGTLLAYPMR